LKVNLPTYSVYNGGDASLVPKRNEETKNQDGETPTTKFLCGDGTWETPSTGPIYKQGTNISISADGTISCTVTDTNTTYSAGTGITIDANNKISAVVPTKTSELTNDSGYAVFTICKSFEDLQKAIPEGTTKSVFGMIAPGIIPSFNYTGGNFTYFQINTNSGDAIAAIGILSKTLMLDNPYVVTFEMVFGNNGTAYVLNG
jgi:hypothetical protein